MNAKKITLIFIPINIILAFLFTIVLVVKLNYKLAKERIAENVQKQRS